ncbi:hypothetical protein NONI108955_21685 [Nocardia ninae]
MAPNMMANLASWWNCQLMMLGLAECGMCPKMPQ